jgi:sugar lactone lactonase YvrE
MKNLKVLFLILIFVIIGCSGEAGVIPSNDVINNNNNNNDTGVDVDVILLCPNGTDEDNDGYGDGCAMGPDCVDDNEFIHPGRPEICNNMDDNCNEQVDEGVMNECGDCALDCQIENIGEGTDLPTKEDATNVNNEGTGRDENGDIILDQTADEYYYMWISNTNDLAKGTVSKIDTRNVREIGRYFSVTCFSRPNSYYNSGLCLDIYGQPIHTGANAPSRTAVDYKFDVYVANRAFGNQASVTKIANKLSNCIDRNGDGIIQTSTDWDGNGQIETDCDADGLPDDIGTLCTTTDGSEPEFYGLDDECVLFTTNYAPLNGLGRSICLDKGDSALTSNIWVATFNAVDHDANAGTESEVVFYHIDGVTGQFIGSYNGYPVPRTASNGYANVYGCVVDGDGMLWTSAISQGCTTYLDTVDPLHPTGRQICISEQFTGTHQNYGITVDDNQNIWYGGWGSRNIYRYAPNRLSPDATNYFDELGNGQWTRINYANGNVSGVAADVRGWIWATDDTNGNILRIDQDIPQGDYTNTSIDLFTAYNWGGNMRGMGIDFDGNVWGVVHNTSMAHRITLDATGDRVLDATGNPLPVQSLPVGTNPYTYSDFTGYGLRNFTEPHGTYTYVFEGCPNTTEPPTWHGIEWTANEPPQTSIVVYIQTANDLNDFQNANEDGPWETSPADFTQAPGPLTLNPARYIKVIFLFTTEERDLTPSLSDFQLIFDCPQTAPEK